MITVLVFTDGRGHALSRTLQSFRSQVSGPITDRVIIDDSVDTDYGLWLESEFPEFRVVHHARKRGFCGAIQSGWSQAEDARYVFHLEDDFTFNRPVDLQSMMDVLDSEPHLIQLALRRQPWNEQEIAAGGIVEMWPNEYNDRCSGEHHWLEHRLFFTTNPTLYRADMTRHGWPEPPACEQAFTKEILEDPDARFAFWGKRSDAPWVHHIGDHRVGIGY